MSLDPRLHLVIRLLRFDSLELFKDVVFSDLLENDALFEQHGLRHSIVVKVHCLNVLFQFVYSGDECIKVGLLFR